MQFQKQLYETHKSFSKPRSFRLDIKACSSQKTHFDQVLSWNSAQGRYTCGKAEEPTSLECPAMLGACVR